MGVVKLAETLLNTPLQEAIAAELRRDPSRSNRSIAEVVGCDHKLVCRIRRRLEEAGEIPLAMSETPAPERTSEEWREAIGSLEVDLSRLDAEISDLERLRAEAALKAAAGDAEAKTTLEQAGRRLAARQARRADVQLMLEAAQRGLQEAEQREAAEKRAAKRAELEALSRERLAAARAVDAALEKLAEAIKAYKRACDEQARLAPEAGLGRRQFEYNEFIVSEAASTHLYRLLPELRHVSYKEQGTLVSKDPITRALVEGGGAV